MADDSRAVLAHDAPPCPWRARPVRIAFRLGEVGLGSVTLRSMTLSTHFLRLVGGAAEPELPFERFPGGTEVAIALSYPTPERLPRLAILPRAIRYVPARYPHHSIDLSGSFESYLAGFSSKSRWTLRKKIGRFSRLSGGAIEWRVFGREAMDEFHRLAFAVSEKTYQARLLGSGLPGLERFRDEVSRRDDARGYVLSHAGKPVAYLFCPAVDGILLYQYVGYDPAYQRSSPGTVLQALALESLFGEGRFRAFDFTEGEGDHKAFFATRSVPCADLYYFRKSPRNVLIVGLLLGLHALSRGSALLLGALGLKGRLKKLIRANA